MAQPHHVTWLSAVSCFMIPATSSFLQQRSDDSSVITHAQHCTSSLNQRLVSGSCVIEISWNPKRLIQTLAVSYASVALQARNLNRGNSLSRPKAQLLSASRTAEACGSPPCAAPAKVQTTFAISLLFSQNYNDRYQAWIECPLDARPCYSRFSRSCLSITRAREVSHSGYTDVTCSLRMSRTGLRPQLLELHTGAQAFWMWAVLLLFVSCFLGFDVRSLAVFTSQAERDKTLRACPSSNPRQPSSE